jgi:putative spermidine/putrescine transport system permease protein
MVGGLKRINMADKAFHILALGMFLYMVLPVIFAVLVSFTPSKFIEVPKSFSLHWDKEFFSSIKWLSGLKNSFYIGMLTTVMSLTIGMSTAFAMVRYKYRWKAVMNTMVLIPIFTPAVIIAMGLLAYFQKLQLWGTYLSVAIAHSLWSVPLVFLVLKVSLEGIDPTLEEAAAGLGASGFRTFYEVTLPLIIPGIIVGILFAFIISVNEFVMALFLTTVDTETLPRIIWPNLRYLLTPLVAAASGVLTLLTISVLLISAKLINVQKLLEIHK